MLFDQNIPYGWRSYISYQVIFKVVVCSFLCVNFFCFPTLILRCCNCDIDSDYLFPINKDDGMKLSMTPVSKLLTDTETLYSISNDSKKSFIENKKDNGITHQAYLNNTFVKSDQFQYNC